MRKLLIGLLMLGSISTFAVNHRVETLKGDRKGKIFETLKTSSGIEMREQLDSLYSRNSLDEEKKYLLIKVDEHPGLICATSVNLNSDEYNFDVDFKNDNEKTLITEYREEDGRFVIIFTSCAPVTYISNFRAKSMTVPDAINSSINSMVISKSRIYKPEDSASTRIRVLSNSVMKIEHIEQIDL